MSIDFHKLRVAEVRRETPDAVSVRFELPEHLRDAFKFKAGQHLTFRRDVNGEELRRNYSVCVAPAEGVLKIGVKKIAGGAFSGQPRPKNAPKRRRPANVRSKVGNERLQSS